MSTDHATIRGMKLLRAAQIFLFSLPLVLTSCLGLILATPSPAGATAATCSNLTTSLGTDTVSVSIPSYGTYRVWVRELATASNASNFYLQIPDAGLCAVSMGGSNLPTNTWTWVDYSAGNSSAVVNATLSSGSHSVELGGQSSGVELDKVMLLSDASCTPTGDGSNCTQGTVATATPTPGTTNSPTPTPTSVPVGGGGSSSNPPTVSGDINLSPVDIPADATNVQYFLDGQPVTSGQINTKDLSNGVHTITVKATVDGKVVTHTSKIVVDNKHSLLQNITGFLQAHRTATTAVAIIVIAVPLAGFAAIHFGLLGATAGGAAAPLATAGGVSAAGTGLTMPQANHDAGAMTLPIPPSPNPATPTPDAKPPAKPPVDPPAPKPPAANPPVEPPVGPPTPTA